MIRHTYSEVIVPFVCSNLDGSTLAWYKSHTGSLMPFNDFQSIVLIDKKCKKTNYKSGSTKKLHDFRRSLYKASRS